MCVIYSLTVLQIVVYDGHPRPRSIGDRRAFKCRFERKQFVIYRYVNAFFLLRHVYFIRARISFLVNFTVRPLKDLHIKTSPIDLTVFWISTGCGHDAFNKITERGNVIGNSWLDL